MAGRRNRQAVGHRASARSRAISTDILDFRARVLAISGGKGRSRTASLIPDTVLPLYSWTARAPVLPAVASRRTGPPVPVVGRAVSTGRHAAAFE